MIAAIYARKSTEQNGIGEEAISVAQHGHEKVPVSEPVWGVHPTELDR